MSAPPSTRKRKRDDDLGESILIGAHTASPFDNPVRITPTVILPRSYVPLQWLAGVPSRLFYSPNNISSLAVLGNIAVVKMEGERQLSAIEALEDNAYVIYKLSTQVRLKDVRKLAAQLARLKKDFEPAEPVGYGEDWWEDVGSMTYPFSEPLTESMRAVKLDVTNDGMPVNDNDNVMRSYSVDVGGSASPKPILSTIRQSSTEILSKLRESYYETLYLSKTSLAYFPKSTLSRTRAYFQEDDPSNPAPVEELYKFLQSMILPLGTMDHKHRKTLPTFASEERIDDASMLSPEEENYIQNWRTLAFGDRFVPTSCPKLKHVMDQLKTRETELQIIILLEIMALQNSYPALAVIAIPAKGKKKATKSKKKLKAAAVADLDTHLELLVDRLCIWHSIGPDLALSGKDEHGKTEHAAPEKDHLRNFSMEVIMPFYSSKLADKCASINKKLGVRQPSTSKRSSRDKSRISRTPSNLSNKDKENSKEPSQNSQVPKLGRSNTVASMASVIDGDSQTSATESQLSALVAEAQNSRSRGGNLNHRNLTKREVQFEKPDPKKAIDEELKDAIRNLTKPNRMAVSRDFVNSVEERKGYMRKQKKPTRTPSNVLVSATPRKRKMSTPARVPVPPPLSYEYDGFDPALVAATPLTIPSTLPPDPGLPISIPGTPKRKRETPLFERLTKVSRPNSAPKSSDVPAIFETPGKVCPQTPDFNSPAGDVSLLQTPIKKTSTKISAPSFQGATSTHLKSTTSIQTTPVRKTPAPPFVGVKATPLHPSLQHPIESIFETPAKKSPPKRLTKPLVEETPMAVTSKAQGGVTLMMMETPVKKPSPPKKKRAVSPSEERKRIPVKMSMMMSDDEGSGSGTDGGGDIFKIGGWGDTPAKKGKMLQAPPVKKSPAKEWDNEDGDIYAALGWDD